MKNIVLSKPACYIKSSLESAAQQSASQAPFMYTSSQKQLKFAETHCDPSESTSSRQPLHRCVGLLLVVCCFSSTQSNRTKLTRNVRCKRKRPQTQNSGWSIFNFKVFPPGVKTVKTNGCLKKCFFFLTFFFFAIEDLQSSKPEHGISHLCSGPQEVKSLSQFTAAIPLSLPRHHTSTLYGFYLFIYWK